MKTAPPEPKRVLHIIDGFGAGGAETWLLATVKYLKANPSVGLQFDFLAAGGQERIFDEEIRQQGSNIFYLKYSYRNFFRFRKGLKKILTENKYIAVHNHQDFISGWHFLLGAGYWPPVKISHLHNPYNFVHNYVVSPLRWVSFKLGRLLMVLLTDKITGTSNLVMDEYGYNKWPYKSKRVAPAYCGFDTSQFRFKASAKATLAAELGWQTHSRVGLFAGRIGLQDYDTAANQKNPVFAFDVATTLIQQHNDWNFAFVGFKGKQGEELEQKALAAGVEDRIRFLGLRKDIFAIMSAADVLLFPSLWEGLGMVAVEAQAAGLPVLASDSIPEEAILVKELLKRKSLSAPVSEWVDAIPALADQQLASRESYNAAIRNSPFSIENSVQYLATLYNQQ